MKKTINHNFRNLLYKIKYAIFKFKKKKNFVQKIIIKILIIISLIIN